MKNIYFLISVLICATTLSFSQQKEGEAIKKMNASADLTVEWLKKNVKLSEAQAEDLLKILKVPEETFKELGSLGKEYPDSLLIIQAQLSAKIKTDIENVLTPAQLEKYNSKKEEFKKWLEKKLKELGY